MGPPGGAKTDTIGVNTSERQQPLGARGPCSVQARQSSGRNAWQLESARTLRLSLCTVRSRVSRHRHAALPELRRRGAEEHRGDPRAAGDREDPDAPGLSVDARPSLRTDLRLTKGPSSARAWPARLDPQPPPRGRAARLKCYHAGKRPQAPCEPGRASVRSCARRVALSGREWMGETREISDQAAVSNLGILYRVMRQRLKMAGYDASPETALAQPRRTALHSAPDSTYQRQCPHRGRLYLPARPGRTEPLPTCG